MKKTEREMLVLAAKAAGIELTRWCAEFPGGGVYVRRVVPAPPEPFSKDLSWDPLSNDGDALRLAVDTKVIFDIQSHIGKLLIEEGAQPSRHAATRRAIVRAAAEIGESMP